MIFKTDKALSLDVSRRFLPFMMAFIIFISSIILAVSGIASHMLNALGNRLTNDAIVQVLPNMNARDPRAELETTMDRVRKVLAADTGVKSFKIPTDKEEAELLRPWLGNMGATSLGIPLPRIIILNPAKNVDYDRLSIALKNISPMINIERSADFSTELKGRITSLKLVLDLMMLIIAAAAAFAIIHAVQASIVANRGAIEILRSIGAANYYIASRLSNRILLSSIAGAAIGFALSIATLYYLRSSLAGTSGALDIPTVSLEAAFVLPVVAAVFAKFISFFATMFYLRGKPS